MLAPEYSRHSYLYVCDRDLLILDMFVTVYHAYVRDCVQYIRYVYLSMLAMFVPVHDRQIRTLHVRYVQCLCMLGMFIIVYIRHFRIRAC